MSDCPMRPGGHVEFQDPRKAGTCAACGAPMPKEVALPEHVDGLFTQLGELLESAGHKPRDLPAPDFDAYRQHSLARAWEGERLYQDRWRGLDMLPELLDELPDVANYTAGEIAKKGVHPRLMQGLMWAFLAYSEFRQYQAEVKAGDPNA